MSVVAAYPIFVCELFVVQRGMWTGYSQSTYLSAPDYDMQCAIETCRSSEIVLM